MGLTVWHIGAMKKLMTLAMATILMAGMLILPTGCGSSSGENRDIQELGERLVVEYYEGLDLGDSAVLAAKFASSFQSVISTGPSSREAVLATIDAETFGDFALSDFTTTRAGSTLTVSYRGTIAVDGVAYAPTWRVNVFTEIDGDWLGIAFADAGEAP